MSPLQSLTMVACQHIAPSDIDVCAAASGRDKICMYNTGRDFNEETIKHNLSHMSSSFAPPAHSQTPIVNSLLSEC